MSTRAQAMPGTYARLVTIAEAKKFPASRRLLPAIGRADIAGLLIIDMTASIRDAVISAWSTLRKDAGRIRREKLSSVLPADLRRCDERFNPPYPMTTKRAMRGPTTIRRATRGARTPAEKLWSKNC